MSNSEAVATILRGVHRVSGRISICLATAKLNRRDLEDAAAEFQMAAEGLRKILDSNKKPPSSNA